MAVDWVAVAREEAAGD